MLGRMAGPGGGGVSEQRQREAAFDFGRHTGTAAVLSLPPPPQVPPKLLFMAAGSGGVVSGEEALFSPAAELAAGPVVVMVSPTSTMQAPTGSPTTSPAATAVPFSRRGATTSSSSGGDDRRRRCKSRSQQRPWEARPVGVGLAGALNGDGADDDRAEDPAAVPELLRVVVRAAGLRPRKQEQEPEPEPEPVPVRLVVAEGGDGSVGGLHPRHRARAQPEDEFLRWCHGCSKDLGQAQGNDIFMYRGEMAFCSHECRCRQMLLFFDGSEEESS